MSSPPKPVVEESNSHDEKAAEKSEVTHGKLGGHTVYSSVTSLIDRNDTDGLQTVLSEHLSVPGPEIVRHGKLGKYSVYSLR